MAGHELGLGYCTSVPLKEAKEPTSAFLDFSFVKCREGFKKKIGPAGSNLCDLVAAIGPEEGLAIFGRTGDPERITSEGWVKVYHSSEMRGMICLWNPTFTSKVGGSALAVALEGGIVNLLQYKAKDSTLNNLHFKVEPLYNFELSLHSSQNRPENPAISAISWSCDGNRLLVWERAVSRVHTTYYVKRRSQKERWAHQNLKLDNLLPENGVFASFFGCCSPTDYIFVTTCETSRVIGVYYTTSDYSYAVTAQQWQLARYTRTNGGIICLKFSNNGLLLAALTATGVQTWNVRGKGENASLLPHDSLAIESPRFFTLGSIVRDVFLVTSGDTLQSIRVYLLQTRRINTQTKWVAVDVETDNMGTQEFSHVYGIDFHHIRQSDLCILGSYGCLQIWGIGIPACQRNFLQEKYYGETFDWKDWSFKELNVLQKKAQEFTQHVRQVSDVAAICQSRAVQASNVAKRNLQRLYRGQVPTVDEQVESNLDILRNSVPPKREGET